MHCDVNGVAYIVSWLGNDTNCTYKHQMDEVNTDDNTLTTSLTKCYEIDILMSICKKGMIIVNK